MPSLSHHAAPGLPYKRLDALRGRWQTEGRTLDGSALTVKAEDTYEWLPGGQFLVHRWQAKIGEETSGGIEIIGYDATQEEYFFHYYDSTGQSGRFRGTVSENTWTLTGEAMKATLFISKDGRTMNAGWETSDNGADWKPWMQVVLHRIDP